MTGGRDGNIWGEANFHHPRPLEEITTTKSKKEEGKVRGAATRT